MPKQLTAEEIKSAVKQGYTERLGSGSCCGPTTGQEGLSCACGDLADLGYSPAQLAGLPVGAVTSAFGCGNPAAFSNVREGEVVLDIGSGAGIDCLIAARRVGSTGKVIGLDMTPAMIEKARQNAGEAGMTNVEFRLGEADAMPVADGSVDWVISNCVINLAPDKKKVFREVARVLKPGGRVAISDIVFADDAPELPAALAADPELYVGCVAGAIREAEYLEAMREAGLIDVAVTARMVYGADMVDVFFRETIHRVGSDSGLESVLDEVKGAVAERVWSARIVGRKPRSSERTPESVSEPVTIDAARASDAPTIEALLASVELPAAKLREQISNFLVARAGGQIVGCVGLELYGDTALLRSLAVVPAQRGQGVGARLVNGILERARGLRATEALLLTTTVQGMAAGMGFEEVPRESVPAAVRESWEFKNDGCRTATCMRLALSR